MSKDSPKVPIKASHRFILKCMKILCKGKVEFIPSEFEKVSFYFAKNGGKWEPLFRGDPKQVDLLKRVIKKMYKKGMFTKKVNWE